MTSINEYTAKSLPLLRLPSGPTGTEPQSAKVYKRSRNLMV